MRFKFRTINDSRILAKRFSYNWLWLTYYWNLSCSLLNFRIPYWFFNYTKPLLHTSYLKPKLLTVPKHSVRSHEFNPKTVVKKPEYSNFLNLYFFSSIALGGLSVYTKYVRPHANFLLLFMDHNRYGSFTFNLKRCYSRWQNTYSLIYNTFYYNYGLCVFGHKFFRFDILTLNTDLLTSNPNIYKYATLFHYFKDSIYGANLVKVLKIAKTLDIDTAFISDLTNNEKMARNLKVCDVYTIGIVSFADDPWLVSYPVPVHSNGLFTQYYFIRYVYHMKQNAFFTRYTQYKNIWKCV